MTTSEPAAESEKPQPVPFAEFLEATPPGQLKKVSGLLTRKHSQGGSYYELVTPELSLHCTTESCNGTRFFRFSDGDRIVRDADKHTLTFFTYICSNCRRGRKVFALHAFADGDPITSGSCIKFGENPSFGPPTPTRLLRLFGPDRETLKGRRCENQGLGIGAFGYYRRVVENHKNQIFDEIIRVAEKVGAPTATIETLKAGRSETQFSRALSSVKDAMPQVLLIGGQNPMTLLHSALSAGLHEQDDERCLELAHDVRVVMSELAERMGQVLKDEAELNSAVSRLMRSRSEKK